MNYSAQQILHVYKNVKKEQVEALKKLSHKPKCAFGQYYFNVDEVFNICGDTSLKFEYVGYGGINFLGNINGVTHTKLFYKNEGIKKEIESFIRVMQQIEDDKRETVNLIVEQHDKPNLQYAILWQQA